MVSRFFKCDPDRLKLLLADQLAEEGQRELAEHLETCQACRQRLEMLAADEKWWSEARASLRGQPAAASPAAAAGGQGGAADRVATDAGQCDTAEIPLEFLAPKDQPRKLGRLGSYEIEAIVGSGGMGVVLKGFDPQLSRHVAIKVLLPLLATSAAARRRFAREARAAAAIVHEHVVPIHAVDFAGDLPYLVMPLIVGRSLQQRIDQEGPLGVKEILRIGMQTAAGLGAAHAQGLVHRDVKPANILLENGVERVMITDFGLARAMDDASCTRSGVVAGTPQYMAPEQAEGHTVDHRADLFGLGSVLYAMCTGRPPFRAETTMAVLRRICEGQPRPIREIYPEIPDWLVAIIAKLHQKDPAERFQSAAEVADLLGRSLAHVQQPLAVPLPRGLRPHLWRRITLGLRRHAAGRRLRRPGDQRPDPRNCPFCRVAPRKQPGAGQHAGSGTGCASGTRGTSGRELGYVREGRRHRIIRAGTGHASVPARRRLPGGDHGDWPGPPRYGKGRIWAAWGDISRSASDPACRAACAAGGP
jgi:serine/threonine protein kinase